MRSFNLSALAVRERAITLFFIFASACAGIYAYFHLGRAEDPSFTIKVLTVTAVWPGAAAQEMQDLVAEPLEKRLQELRWYDRVETITRSGLALMTPAPRSQQRLRRPDGSELQIEFYGPEDGPPIILTHGWGLDSREWNYLKRDLSGVFRLIVWDEPGLGSPPAQATATTAWRTLRAILKQ